MVLLNNEKSLVYYSKLDACTVMVSYEDAVRGNPSFENPANEHPNRKRFFKLLDKNSCLDTLIVQNMKYSFFYRVKQYIRKNS